MLPGPVGAGVTGSGYVQLSMQASYEDIDNSTYLLRTRDQASGGELAAFATTGDGTYPVWVGRSDAGEVVGVVVLIEGTPELLPETAAAVA